MNRSIALAAFVSCALLASWAPGGAQPASPSPAASSAAHAAPKKTPGFSNKVKVPPSHSSTVSSAACNRRAVGVTPPNNTMSVNGATKSQTLIAIPIGGGSTANATTQQQITEACNHQRH